MTWEVVFVHVSLVKLVLCISGIECTPSAGPHKDLNYINVPDSSKYLNYTSLMVHYISVCGYNRICNRSNIPFLDIPKQDNEFNKQCKTCACDDECFYRTDSPCCPDLYFKYGMLNCRGIDVLSNIEPEDGYKFIDSCPAHDVSDGNCFRNWTAVEKLTLPPVTSGSTKVTYLNRYCASCNGVRDGHEWNLEFDCPVETDMNYLSSYEEIINVANTSKCSVKFKTDVLNFQRANMQCNNRRGTTNYEIRFCNVSGTWSHYDVSLELACHTSYEQRYGVFKNVFCAMCNPPKTNINTNKITSTCNETGLLKTCDDVMTQECEKYPMVQMTYPFKNIFCFLCNIESTDHKQFTDLNLDELWVSVDTSEKHIFQIEMKVSFKSNTVIQKIKEMKDSILKSSYKVQNNLIQKYSINLTDLIHQSFAFSDSGICDPYLLPNYTLSIQKSCSCSLGCNMYTCCDDFGLMQPINCITDSYPPMKSHNGTFKVIDGCLKVQSPFKLQCENVHSKDFYHNLPVTVQYENSDMGSYLNIFCFLCNKDENVYSNEEELYTLLKGIQISGLKILCDSYVEIRFFMTFAELSDYINSINCVIKTTHASYQLCERKKFKISTCNVTGGWRTENRNVRIACENTEYYRFPVIGPFYNENGVTYKNKFCKICNPRPLFGDLIEECNHTGSLSRVDETTQAACYFFPRTHGCSEFKNRFCEQCNEHVFPVGCIYEISGRSGSSGIAFDDINRQGNVVYRISYRSIFSFTKYQEGEHTPTSSTCKENQIYYKAQRSCLNITCFPGKVLVNSSCTPLLQYTKNLRYTISFKITFMEVIHHKMIHILKESKKYLDDKLFQLQLTNFEFEDIIFMVEEECESSNITDLELFVHVNVFVRGMVDRLLVERNLFTFLNSSINISLFNSNYSIKMEDSQFAFLLPSIAKIRSHTKRCLFMERGRRNRHFRNSFVSNLLICKQIIFQPNEIETDESRLQIKIITFDVWLPYNKFEVTNDGEVRVCINDIKNFLNLSIMNVNHSDFALYILTIICLSVSLVCLLLTFITYSLFKSLRTIPGMNTMLLIFSLFFAQIIMILRSLIISSSFMNSFLSVLTHYFWLCVFFWLQICSFHMFRVFTSNFKLENTGSSVYKKTAMYGLYAFGIPALIVSGNIIVSLSLSRGTSMGYESQDTLMNNRTSFIITLISPLIIVCITNIFFFAFTAYKIRTTPDVQKANQQKMNFLIYIKLFALTGLTWVIQIVDTFSSLSVLSFIVAILNGLQGLFLFLSYVCNNRVYRMYCKKFTSSTQVSGSSRSYSTQDTKF